MSVDRTQKAKSVDTWTGDAESLVIWLREAADELERAHAYLDHLQVPRSVVPPIECTLAARIVLLADTLEDAAGT